VIIFLLSIVILISSGGGMSSIIYKIVDGPSAETILQDADMLMSDSTNFSIRFISESGVVSAIRNTPLLDLNNSDITVERQNLSGYLLIIKGTIGNSEFSCFYNAYTRSGKLELVTK